MKWISAGVGTMSATDNEPLGTPVAAHATTESMNIFLSATGTCLKSETNQLHQQTAYRIQPNQMCSVLYSLDWEQLTHTKPLPQIDSFAPADTQTMSNAKSSPMEECDAAFSSAMKTHFPDMSLDDEVSEEEIQKVHGEMLESMVVWL